MSLRTFPEATSSLEALIAAMFSLDKDGRLVGRAPAYTSYGLPNTSSAKPTRIYLMMCTRASEPFVRNPGAVRASGRSSTPST